MTTSSFEPRARDRTREGWVARLSAGGWTDYHRMDCPSADRRQGGVRAVVRGPWRYLSHHWNPCPHCRPPGDDASS